MVVLSADTRIAVAGMASELTKIEEIAIKIEPLSEYKISYMSITNFMESNILNDFYFTGIIAVSKSFPVDILEKMTRSEYGQLSRFVMIEKMDMPVQLSFVDATGDERTWIPLLMKQIGKLCNLA